MNSSVLRIYKQIAEPKDFQLRNIVEFLKICHHVFNFMITSYRRRCCETYMVEHFEKKVRQLLVVNYFFNKLHHRCLTGF